MRNNFMKRLFLLFFILIPSLVNSEIKVEIDSASGEKTISSIISNSNNPITEVVFRASLKGEYWLEMSKIDKKCWFFKGQLELILTYMNISVSPQFKATEILNFASKTEACTTKALFNVSNTVNRLSEAQSVVMMIDFKNKSSIKWKLPKNVLNEWKSVIDLKNFENINRRIISRDTINSTVSDSELISEEGEFVEIQEQPELIKTVQPEYPLKALENKIEGKVIVAILVDKNGKVIQAKIARSSGTDVGFEEAALQAAYKNVYKPAIQNNKPVAVWIYYPVYFRLK